MGNKVIYTFLGSLIFLSSLSAYAAEMTVNVYSLVKSGPAKSLGTVTFADSPYGLLITPDLHGLPPGLHGFHIHTTPSCADEGMAAGGHFDPQNTEKHLGPYSSKGHLGDLPALYVDKKGNAALSELAPRLKVSDIQDHALMIHAGGDNYSDHPPMGGGGARIACGVIG